MEKHRYSIKIYRATNGWIILGEGEAIENAVVFGTESGLLEYLKNTIIKPLPIKSEQ